ncbi:peroxisomal biogenesis factor 11 [Basidiobolus meristosporus CBS 931.73]|uniref:Peroxisomal biogenesis factor 11 n=1 Tax=Basidiobolus meristosporus CBS 931.73 TaxID=1314790 RepID=A0A1Y1XWU1_9FUNG|nr:peroxisomal biogenesis factor 11 [Basidiobolus meristosporus CBS 931.73]|eukprot:ORX89946.1 peroxisomal biogenesis factor 11 [Basidiobolus meristosporus CBS 931.73]
MSSPVVNTFVKYSATTNGRDKFYRLLQYLSRFFSWYLVRQGYSKEAIFANDKLKAHLAVARRLLRLGKPIEWINTMVKSTSIQDDLLRVCSIGRAASMAAYLTLDMLSWVNMVGMYKFKSAKKITDNANRFWLYGILLAWISDLYKLRQHYLQYETVKRVQSVKQEQVQTLDEETSQKLRTLTTARKELVTQFVIDSVDLLLPLSALKYVNLNEGVIGLAGVLTSFLGANNQWSKCNS